MKTLFTFIINSLYVVVILIVVVSLSFVALSNKEQIASLDKSKPITGTVIKQEVPVLSTISGSVHTMKLTVGQKVKQDDVLLELTASGSALSKSSVVTKDSMQSVSSPIQGVVEKIFVQEGYGVSPDTPLVTLLSDDNINVSVSLSDDEYQRLAKLDTVRFYSPRLDQSFVAVPGVTNPNVGNSALSNGTITVSYTFTNPHEAISLLQGEQMQVLLPSPSTDLPSSLSQVKSFFHL